MPKGLDFIIIGAQKAGTTSLFEHLRDHPELYLPPGKERPFFSHDDVFTGGWPRFASGTFGGAPVEARWGKSTPSYMYGCPVRNKHRASDRRHESERTEWIVPERIRAQFPDVKLIAILRDPIERCLSNYRMHAMGKPSFPPFDRLIAALLEPEALEDSRRLRRGGFITRGEYGRILQGYFETFADEQIFVCFTSDLERTPVVLMREVFEFLSVDPNHMPRGLTTRFQEGAAAHRVGWLRSPSDLQKRLIRQPGVRSLWGVVPDRARRRVTLALREANYRFDLWNRRGGGSDHVDARAETLARLRGHYEEDRVLLERLIGKPVPWGSVSGSQYARAEDGLSRS
jgi:hypothetical protein